MYIIVNIIRITIKDSFTFGGINSVTESELALVSGSDAGMGNRYEFFQSALFVDHEDATGWKEFYPTYLTSWLRRGLWYWLTDRDVHVRMFRETISLCTCVLQRWKMMKKTSCDLMNIHGLALFSASISVGWALSQQRWCSRNEDAGKQTLAREQ